MGCSRPSCSDRVVEVGIGALDLITLSSRKACACCQQIQLVPLLALILRQLSHASELFTEWRSRVARQPALTITITPIMAST